MDKCPLPANGSSVDKALSILLAFTPYNQERGTTELAQKLGMHKSTTSRLIQGLVTGGFLQQNPATRKYSLGGACHRIAYAVTRSLDSRLMTTAHPFMLELARETRENVALEVLSGIDIILALHVDGPSHLRYNFRQGELVPFNVAAGAKAILAHSDPEFLENCLNRTFERFNERTIVDKEQYRQLLAQVRNEGIAYDRGERYTEIHAMAAPIHNPVGPPTAAVIISGPASRLDESFLKRAAKPLKQAAAKIAKGLYE
ncbi:MAG: IclR family transcriptional regulator [Desulfopila sp.]